MKTSRRRSRAQERVEAVEFSCQLAGVELRHGDLVVVATAVAQPVQLLDDAVGERDDLVVTMSSSVVVQSAQPPTETSMPCKSMNLIFSSLSQYCLAAESRVSSCDLSAASRKRLTGQQDDQKKTSPTRALP